MQKLFSPSPSSRHSLPPRSLAPATSRCTCATCRSARGRSQRRSRRTALQHARRALARHRHRRLPHAHACTGRGGRWRTPTRTSARRRTGPWHDGNLDWTGASSGVAVPRHGGTVPRLRSYELWSRVTAAPARALSQAGSPAIVPRAGWGADEEIVRAKPLDRADAAARRRPSHGRHEHVHARAGGGDRARDRGLPRAGKRLERHRLQLSRRPLRHGLRGPRRRHRHAT